MIQLIGKKILITGSSSGIGRATAIEAAKAGAKLVLMARRKDLLTELVESLHGSGHHFFSVDLTDEEALATALKESLSDNVPYDGFVHSAGMEMTIPLKMLNQSHILKALELNTFSAFHISRLLLAKNSFSPGGSIVFISSIMAALGQPAKIAYCASKAALCAGAKAMALELAPKKIRVNSILPGMVESDMSLGLLSSLSEENVTKIKEMHPLGIGSVIDVANAVCFLISDLSSWITGSEIIIDGGYSAK